jgi:hypothetical protein
MSKLSDIAKGNRAIKKVPLPLVNVPAFLSADVPELAAQRESDRAAAIEKGEPAVPDEVMVGLRVLTQGELTEVYEKAGDFARKHGVKEPNETDPIYNIGLSVYTCVMACVDPDSDPRDPEPFFGARADLESGALELLASPHIGRDGIAYLQETQEAWQDMCNPRASKVPPSVFYDSIVSLADKEQDVALRTFLGYRPAMHFRLLRTMAGLLVNLQQGKSSPGATIAEMKSSGSSQQS